MKSNKTFDKIVTVTLNPSLDATLWIDKLDLDEPVKCLKEIYYPGGKGLNVSRVLTALAQENTALFITGRENSKKLSVLLDKENVNYDSVENQGAIRENLSIVTSENKMLKINRNGFSVSEEILKELEDKILEHILNAKSPLLVFAGSLPQNVTKERYKALCIKFKAMGCEIVLDNDIFSCSDIKEIKPFLIKPNAAEIGHMFSREMLTKEECISFARQLAESTAHVLVSMGGEGLLYCAKNTLIQATVPNVLVKSTVGAGDTALAGFIASYNDGCDILEALRFSAACATASVELAGTEIITKKHSLKMYKNIEINKISS